MQRIANIFVYLGGSKVFISIITIILLLEISLLITNHKISIGVSDSLPFHIFLVNKNIGNLKNLKSADYIQFRNKNTKYYNGKYITKQILATGGDVLEINQFNKPINNIQAKIEFNGTILDVKDFTPLGTKLHTNNIEKIPENYFFVIGTHKNSFDSRYMEFGLINREDIIGTVKPLL